MGAAQLPDEAVVEDVQRTAPGLLVAAGAPSGTGFAWVSMRGQGNLSAGLASDPAVGIYIDGVYIPRPSQALLELTDLARVEVLRGPQGTLFGRNTTGGALNFISTEPTDRLEGRVQASYGNYGAWKAGVLLNAPLGEGLAFRGTFDYSHSDGYGINPVSNLRLRNLKSPNARGKFVWNPGGGDFKITLAGDYSRAKDNGVITVIDAINPASPLAAIRPVAGGPSFADLLMPFLHGPTRYYTSNSTGFGPTAFEPRPSYSDTKAYGGSATIEASLGAVDLKSITAYRYSYSDALIDQDASPFPLLTNISMVKKIYENDQNVVSTMTAKYKDLKSEQDKLKDMQASLKSQKSEMTAKRETLSSKKSELNEKKSSVSASNQKISQEISELQSEADELANTGNGGGGGGNDRFLPQRKGPTPRLINLLGR